MFFCDVVAKNGASKSSVPHLKVLGLMEDQSKWLRLNLLYINASTFFLLCCSWKFPYSPTWRFFLFMPWWGLTKPKQLSMAATPRVIGCAHAYRFWPNRRDVLWPLLSDGLSCLFFCRHTRSVYVIHISLPLCWNCCTVPTTAPTWIYMGLGFKATFGFVSGVNGRVETLSPGYAIGLTKPKQLPMAATQRVIRLCACVQVLTKPRGCVVWPLVKVHTFCPLIT